MDPFRDYQEVVAATQHCPTGGCAVCCSHPALVRREFANVVQGSWSPAELDILSKAASSALL